MLPCGPAHVEELARNAESRVYVQDGVAYGCSGAASIRLGTQVVGVTLAGRRLVVRRPHELRMYDLRRGIAKERATVADVEAVRVDRSGLAVYIAAGRVRSLRGTFDEPATGVKLRLARGTVAWREGDYWRLQHLGGSSRGSTLLVRQGEVRVFKGLLARLGKGRLRMIGDEFTACETSSGCSGVSHVKIAGRYLAALDQSFTAGTGSTWITLVDLANGTRRRLCHNGSVFYTFTLDSSGAVACATAPE